MHAAKDQNGQALEVGKTRSRDPGADWSRPMAYTVHGSLVGLSALVLWLGPGSPQGTALILLAVVVCLLNRPKLARTISVCIAVILIAGTVQVDGNLSLLVLAPISLLACEGMIRVRRRLVSAERAANVDALTGALTPRGFAKILGNELEAAQRDGRATALIFIDLDHFKTVNDTFGHAAGDRILRGLVSNLKARLLSEDHIARVGGDEFLVFLRYADDPERIDRFQANMLAAVSELPHHLTASAGGLILPPNKYPDPAAIIHSADCLMYDVKDANRGEIRFGTLDEFQKRSGNSSSFRNDSVEAHSVAD